MFFSDKTCEWCFRDYCSDCSDAHDWRRFCSGECEKKYRAQVDSEEVYG